MPIPHRLLAHFAKVKDPRLEAITHVDCSARPQTVSSEQNPLMYQLLTEFKSITKVGVLCNTSLNFNGTGFINRTSDLVRFATEYGLDGFAVDGKTYLKETVLNRIFND